MWIDDIRAIQRLAALQYCFFFGFWLIGFGTCVQIQLRLHARTSSILEDRNKY